MMHRWIAHPNMMHPFSSYPFKSKNVVWRLDSTEEDIVLGCQQYSKTEEKLWDHFFFALDIRYVQLPYWRKEKIVLVDKDTWFDHSGSSLITHVFEKFTRQKRDSNWPPHFVCHRINFPKKLTIFETSTLYDTDTNTRVLQVLVSKTWVKHWYKYTCSISVCL